MNIIRTRHLGNGRVVQTYNGKVIFRGILQDYPVSPDSIVKKR